MRLIALLWLCAFALLPSGAAAQCAQGDGNVIRKVCYGGEIDSDHSRYYGHSVLGATPEWTELTVFYGPQGQDAQEARRGAATAVLRKGIFEDIEPRLADVDNDGMPEAVVVESDPDLGARLAVWEIVGHPEPMAATDPIGRSYRWLAPAGIVDLDGDGQTDIAYVETPHLGKVLRIVTYRDGRLVEIASQAGYSNHRIGDDFITGGARVCDGLAELILPTGDWQRVEAVRIHRGDILATDLGPYRGRAETDALTECQ